MDAKVIAPAQGSAPALFKPFNDCLLSLKGGANFEGQTAPATEKRLKKRKNKTAESAERLFLRILAVFHCINFGVAMFLYTCGYFPDK